MLKLTYTENGFTLDYLTQSLEEWVNTRVLLALRSATALVIEPSTACFLLPNDIYGVTQLRQQVLKDKTEIIAIVDCDADKVEVSLYGTWISGGNDQHEGVFVTQLNDRTEAFLSQVWTASTLADQALLQ